VDEERHRLKIMLSVARSRAMHWMEDHPEPQIPKGFWAHLLRGFDYMAGHRDRIPGAQEMMTRAWAKAWVQTADEVAKEKGLELHTFNRQELPWWETFLYVFPFGDGKGVERPLREHFVKNNLGDVEQTLKDLNDVEPA
jgi:hypothetical protein